MDLESIPEIYSGLCETTHARPAVLVRHALVTIYTSQDKSHRGRLQHGRDATVFFFLVAPVCTWYLHPGRWTSPAAVNNNARVVLHRTYPGRSHQGAFWTINETPALYSLRGLSEQTRPYYLIFFFFLHLLFHSHAFNTACPEGVSSLTHPTLLSSTLRCISIYSLDLPPRPHCPSSFAHHLRSYHPSLFNIYFLPRTIPDVGTRTISLVHLPVVVVVHHSTSPTRNHFDPKSFGYSRAPLSSSSRPNPNNRPNGPARGYGNGHRPPPFPMLLE